MNTNERIGEIFRRIRIKLLEPNQFTPHRIGFGLHELEELNITDIAFMGFLKYLTNMGAIQKFEVLGDSSDYIQGWDDDRGGLAYADEYVGYFCLFIDPKEFESAYNKYKKNVHEIFDEPPSKINLKGAVPRFDVTSGNIIINGINCRIAPNGDKQHHICKELIIINPSDEYRLGNAKTETHLEDSYSLLGAGYKAPISKSTRWIKDAIYKINTKVKKTFGIERFIKFERSAARIAMENFE